jgi:hypothetical protein
MIGLLPGERAALYQRTLILHQPIFKQPDVTIQLLYLSACCGEVGQDRLERCR